jgi:hypothetical protein
MMIPIVDLVILARDSYNTWNKATGHPMPSGTKCSEMHKKLHRYFLFVGY